MDWHFIRKPKFIFRYLPINVGFQAQTIGIDTNEVNILHHVHYLYIDRCSQQVLK